jgi:hypothetical protein
MSIASTTTPRPIVAASATVGAKTGNQLVERKELNRYIRIPSDRLITCENGCFTFSSHLKGHLWKTAAAILLIAFIAIAVGAAVFASIGTSGYLPLVGLVTFALLNPLQTVFTNMWDRGNIHAHNGAIEDNVRGHYKDLEGSDAVRILTEMGISVNQIQNQEQLESLNDLLPLIAHFEFWTKQKQVHDSQIGKLQDALQKEPTIEKLTSLYQAYSLSDQNRKTALVKMAYIHAVILNPCLTGDLEEIGDFVRTPAHLRSTALGLRSPTADNTATVTLAYEIFRFKNPARGSITLDDINNNSVHLKFGPAASA